MRREIQSYTSVAPYPLILVLADIPTTTTGNPGNEKKSDHAPKFSDYLTFALNVTLQLKFTGLYLGS